MDSNRTATPVPHPNGQPAELVLQILQMSEPIGAEQRFGALQLGLEYILQ